MDIVTVEDVGVVKDVVVVDIGIVVAYKGMMAYHLGACSSVDFVEFLRYGLVEGKIVRVHDSDTENFLQPPAVS